jgi:hypothetical protein
MANTSNHNSGRSWSADRRQRNKNESWEKPMSQRKKRYDNGGAITIKDVDEWDVINDWASWKEISPKYNVSYGKIVSDLADFPAYYHNDLDRNEYEQIWKERYNLQSGDNDSILKLETELWDYVLNKAKEDNAFENYVKRLNEEKEKGLLDIPENYNFIRHDRNMGGGTGNYIFIHRNTKKELKLPDWHITEMGGVGGTDIGYVSREDALKKHFSKEKYSKGGGINSGRDLLFKSKQPHEQAYKRKREFKKYGDNGNWFNDFFENGGDIANQNALMVMNDNKQIKHHTEELNKVVDVNTTVPAWIVAKVHRSASDLSDASHYLDGVNTEFKNGGNVSYGYIKKEKERMTDELLKKCGVFFAFSNEQFLANKTPLKEGEKYVSIGGGGYMPKGNIDAFSEGMKSISKLGKNKVKENNLAETEILYELNNHECFYTGDYSDVVDMFKGTYTEEQIRDVYNKHRESNQTFKNGGGVTDVTKNILKEYIFEYKYPKHKNKPSVNQYYSVDTSKVIPIGGMSEDGFKLKFINGNESGTVITVIKALQAIRNGEIEFEQSEGYFVKIKAIKKDSFANGGGISSDIIFVSAKNKEDRDRFFESVTNLMPDHFIIKQGDLSVQLEVNPSDMSSIEQMAKTYNVEVIIDNGVEPSADYGDLISINIAEKALGRKINSWKDDVITLDGIIYRKVFLKPEYKKIK